MSEASALDRSTAIGSAVAGPIGGILAAFIGPGIARPFQSCKGFESPFSGVSRPASTEPPCDWPFAAQLANADQPGFIFIVAFLAAAVTFVILIATAPSRGPNNPTS